MGHPVASVVCPKLITVVLSKEDGMECYRMAERKYKFYLSFEDAICKDYVTEKFFSVYGGLKLIPVVLGGANYSGIYFTLGEMFHLYVEVHGLE